MPGQTQDEIYRLVRRAAINKQPIAAVYDGHERLLCPHVLGISKEGRRQALCYQYGGASSRGLGPGGSAGNWRCIRVEKLSSVRFLKDEWHTGVRHSSRQTCVDQVDVDSEIPGYRGAFGLGGRSGTPVSAKSRAAGAGAAPENQKHKDGIAKPGDPIE